MNDVPFNPPGWKINPAWIEAGKGPHCDVPSWDFVEAVYHHLYRNSTFLKLMNPNESRPLSPSESESIIAAVNSKPKKDLPAGWLHIEAANNGWIIFVRDRPGYGHTVQPDFVFNNVFDCARKIVNLLDPEQVKVTLESDEIRRLSEDLRAETSRRVDMEKARGEWRDIAEGLEREILGLRAGLVNRNTKLAEVTAKLELITAGRDNGDHMIKVLHEECESLRNQVQELQTRLNIALVDLKAALEFRSAPTAAVVDGKVFTVDDLCKEYSLACERLVQYEHRLAAALDAHGVTMVQDFQKSQEQEEVIKGLRKELECASKQLECAARDYERIEQSNIKIGKDLAAARMEIETWNVWGKKKMAELDEARTQLVIRTAERDAEKLNRMLQPPISSGPTMACVDGRFYSVDEVCRLCSEANKEIGRLNGVVGRLHDSLAKVSARRNELDQELEKQTREYVALRGKLGGEWKRGFDAGVERYTTYVKAFSKEIAESIATGKNNTNNAS